MYGQDRSERSRRAADAEVSSVSTAIGSISTGIGRQENRLELLANAISSLADAIRIKGRPQSLRRSGSQGVTGSDLSADRGGWRRSEPPGFRVLLKPLRLHYHKAEKRQRGRRKNNGKTEEAIFLPHDVRQKACKTKQERWQQAQRRRQAQRWWQQKDSLQAEA